MATKETTLALAPLEEGALSIADTMSLMGEEMQGLGSVPMQKVSTPAGGGTVFEVGEDDDAEATKELVGVVVYHHANNVYYSQSIEDSDGDTTPTCSSNDGKTGYDRTTGEVCNCATCPRNQFIDGHKECSNRHTVYMLRENEMLPIMLSLPATSLKNFSNFIAKQVVLKRRRSTSIITKVTLEKAESKSGNPFSRYKFAVAGDLDADAAAKMKEYGDGFKAYIEERNASFAPAKEVVNVTFEEVVADEVPF